MGKNDFLAYLKNNGTLINDKIKELRELHEELGDFAQGHRYWRYSARRELENEMREKTVTLENEIKEEILAVYLDWCLRQIIGS